MRTSLAAILLFVPAIAGGTGISIGGVSLEIPSPVGFGPVTPQMADVYDLHKQAVLPSMELCVSFISEQDFSTALRGDIQNQSRYFSVQTFKDLTGVSVPRSYFVGVKNTIKSQNDDIMQIVERDLPGLMKNVSIPQLVPSPVHEDTDRTIAYSTLATYNESDATGNPISYTIEELAEVGNGR
jgi:hypothetical protein